MATGKIIRAKAAPQVRGSRSRRSSDPAPPPPACPPPAPPCSPVGAGRAAPSGAGGAALPTGPAAGRWAAAAPPRGPALPPRAHHGCVRSAPRPPSRSPPSPLASAGRLRGQPAPRAAAAAEPRAAAAAPAPARVGSAEAHRAPGHHRPQRGQRATALPRLRGAAALPQEQDRALVRGRAARCCAGGDGAKPGGKRSLSAAPEPHDAVRRSGSDAVPPGCSLRVGAEKEH